MKKSNTKKLITMLVCIAALMLALVVAAFAASEEKEDAMVAIEAAFADKQVGTTQRVERDGYIGIPVEITTYYDYANHGAAKPGYNATIAIMYVVNTGVDRVGTKTDVEIITSMLERGYIVSVFDYLNNAKAVSPGLDWSTQTIRKEFLSGKFFTDTTKIPAGSYHDNFVVPAGFDLSYGNVFWEADKHASDGSLEKIVENWNTDFKNWNAFENKIIYWRNALGEQKATDAGAEWFSDAAGKVAVEATAADANYTKVKYTVAKDITDCVGPDGTPIDLNLYMHIVYPTTTAEKPIDPVPVAVLASSSEYLNTASTSSGLRPQHNGFLFNGYAGATFDYLYQPMAQKDYWGYYDGQTSLGGVTGDRMNYGLHLYSDKKINTAAMRYLRYLTYTQGDEFVFDDESIGVFGNSKGGWFTYLGEAELKEYTVEDASKYTKEELELFINNRINAYTSKRQFQNHRDETRFDNGITEAYTKNGVTIDGGELQPWLTYTDKDGNVKEILGYASWIYASNGSQYEDITEGHAPVFSALHLQDDFTTTHNLFSEVTLGLDVPSMYVIVDLGHTFAYGPDYYLGYDTYQAMFDFANYYLKKDAVKVVYTNPTDKTGAMSTTAPITIKFSGAVPASEVEKITLTARGSAVKGTWSSVRGNTEWTFEHEALLPGTAYTLTVPASLAGDNGKAMGTDYTATYYTEDEGVYAVTKTNVSDGAYFTLTAPATGGAADAKIRFYVSNDAANTAELYLVSGFDAENPSAATRGELVSTVALSGAGYYEADVTKYVLEAAAGSELTFFLTAGKTAEVKNNVMSFASSISSVTIGTYARGSVGEAPDGTKAAKVYVTANIRASGSYQYPKELPFYANATTAVTAKNIFGATAFTENDLGRKFRITVRLYDTDTRVVQLSLNRVSSDMLHDKDNASYNFMTEAGKWQELSFDYTVYEPDYGLAGLITKNLTVMLGSTGKDESPVYISDITVTETVSDVSFGDASLVLGQRGGAYKTNGTGDAFTKGSTSYSTLKDAILGAKSGDTIVLNKNYTVTAADDTTAWGSLTNITLDLNGYKLYSESSLPIVHVAATSTVKTNITLKNGSVYLSNAALIGYNGSSAAGKGKSINVTLDNLNVINSDGSVLTNVISASTIESASGANVHVTMNDVNVDFKYETNSKNPVKILSNGSASLNVAYTLKGGSISVDALGGVTVYDSFKKTETAKNSLGNYVTLYVPEGIAVPGMAIMSEGTLKLFKYGSAALGIATYKVTESENATPYGLIPDEYADVDIYPFVFFDENGNFKGAYSKWLGKSGDGSVINAARNYVVNAWNGTTYGENPKEAFIVMRRNYTFESAESYDNLAQVQGTLNIDLGGYTLSAEDYGKPVLAADSKGFSGAAGQKVFPTTVNFTNGKLMHGRNGILSLYTWDSVGDGSIVNKYFNFNFNGITFGFVDNADSVGLIAHTKNPHKDTTVAAPFILTYNDCTFDIRTTKSMHNSAIVFNTNTAGKYIKVTHNVNGGTIIADNPAKITLVSNASDNYDSSVIFGKGSDGNYLSYRTLTGAAAPTGVYRSETSKLSFEAASTDGDDTIYRLKVRSGESFYEEIPTDYPAADYPFAVYNEDGGLIGAQISLWKALDAAKVYQDDNKFDKASGKYTGTVRSAVILLRRNYTVTTGDKYDNYAQIQGEAIIDLNGYTLTQGSGTGGIFYYVTSKPWSGSGDALVFPTTITVKNGNLVVTSGSVVNANMWNNLYFTPGTTTAVDAAAGGVLSTEYSMADKHFTWNFDGVNVSCAPGASGTEMLMYYRAVQAASTRPAVVAAPYYFNYTNCTFDFRNAPAGMRLFNAAPEYEQYIKATVNAYGCEIIANDFNNIKLYTVDDSQGSSMTFAKNADGEYIKLVLPEGVVPPTPTESSFIVIGGQKLYFHETEPGSNVYTLSTCKNNGVTTHKCACGATASYCADTNNDHYCDVCGFKTECIDKDRNHECDICFAKTECSDANLDHYCDLCGERSACIDNSKDHNCDICKERVSECADNNNDHKCDTCGETFSVCNDEDKDGVCDICGLDFTPYGSIPADYTAAAYPFAVFGESGFISAEVSWAAALKKADSVDGSVIYMRRDYTTISSTDATSGIIKLQSGTITIDLGGHTLTRDGAYIFDFYLDAGTTGDYLKYVLKNGTVLANKYIMAHSGSNKATKTKTVDFEFNNVSIVVSSSYGSTAAWFIVAHSNTTYPLVYESNVAFNNCVIDMRNNSTYSVIDVKNNNKDGNNFVDVHVSFNGGEILASTFAQALLYKLGENDSVTFGRGSDDSFTTLKLSKNGTIGTPAYYYTTTDGDNVYFHSVGADDTAIFYELSQCKEKEGSHECDCGIVLSSCADNDNNHLCDTCGNVLTECADNNNDHNCDLCGTKLTDCSDANLDHACDICGAKTECSDANLDHACDVCGAKTECNDANSDHICDLCGEKTECVDEDKNHVCDICGEKSSECADENNDHLCDICGKILSECADNNNDHLCDTCGKALTECGDEDNDHNCDLCGKKISDCADDNRDHNCDICGTKVTYCGDNDNDHYCDSCGTKLTDCNDENSDHNCDICGEKLTECKDENSDHNCDTCGAKLTECIDENGDHNCDTCGEKASECKDENSDHNCDICGEKLTDCKDENSDHKCDTCGAKLTDCKDENSDHNCDSCGTKLTECKDENSDHACDLCGKVISKCADANGDNECDICGKVIDEGKDDEENKPEEDTDDEKTDGEPEQKPEKRTFFQKIGDFFKKIFKAIANLFKPAGKKKA